MPDIVVSEVAAQAIAAAITAQTTADKANTLALTLAMEKYFGTSATTASAGGLVAAVTAGSATQSQILNAINAQTKAINELSLAVGKVAASVESITNAAANIQVTMTQQLTTQQLQAADQIKNSKFQQQTTNAALKRADLPETVVAPDEMKKSISNAVTDIGVIKAQTAATSYLTDTISETSARALKISTEWIASTAFAKWIKDEYAIRKLQAEALFADKEAKAKIDEQIVTLRNARLMPTAAK